jgi:hypothetical protein
MRQFIAPQVLKVNGKPAVCICHDNVVCSLCVQANLILRERAEGRPTFIEEADAIARSARKAREAREIPRKNPSILALERRIKGNTLRTVSRELGVSPHAVTSWIKKGKVPAKYFENGDLIGKEAISRGSIATPQKREQNT